MGDSGQIGGENARFDGQNGAETGGQKTISDAGKTHRKDAEKKRLFLFVFLRRKQQKNPLQHLKKYEKFGILS